MSTRRPLRIAGPASFSRRGFLVGAAALGVGAMTAGCAGTYDVAAGLTGSSGGENSSTLVYWNLLTGGDGTHMEAMEAAYRPPGINLQSTILTWGNPYYTKLSLAIRSGSPPDVAIMHLSRLYEPGCGLVDPFFHLLGFGARAGCRTRAWPCTPSSSSPCGGRSASTSCSTSAGRQDIPRDLYEASALDGASRWTQTRRLTIPMLGRTTTLVVVLQVIASLKILDQVYLITAGGPKCASRTAIEFIYDTGFTSQRVGYASAASLVLFVVIVAVSFVWLALVRRRRKGESDRGRHLGEKGLAGQPVRAGRDRSGHRAGPRLAHPDRVDPRHVGQVGKRYIIIPATWKVPQFTFSAYGAVFSATDLGRWYINSAIVAIVVTALTIPAGIGTVVSGVGIVNAPQMASAVLGALPLVFVFLLAQRQIVEGVAGTGLK